MFLYNDKFKLNVSFKYSCEMINIMIFYMRCFNNKIMPGFLNSVINWFRCYKTAEGKKENKFALNGKILEKKEAIDIIFNTHKLWGKLTDN